jgi:hypothetical protein
MFRDFNLAESYERRLKDALDRREAVASKWDTSPSPCTRLSPTAANCPSRERPVHPRLPLPLGLSGKLRDGDELPAAPLPRPSQKKERSHSAPRQIAEGSALQAPDEDATRVVPRRRMQEV